MVAKCIKIVLLGLVLISLPDDGNSARTMTIYHPGKAASLYDIAARNFAEQVARETSGRLAIHVESNPSVQSYRSAMSILHSSADSIILSSSVLSQISPEFQFFDLPFIVRDRNHMKILENEIVNPFLQPIATGHNLHILCVWEGGFQQITNNQRPVRTVNDLKGLNLRTNQNEWRIRTFQYLGANPTPIPFSETYFAIQKGVVSGMEISISNIVPFRLHETQRFLSITNHVYEPAYVLMGLETYQKIDNPTREALRRASVTTRDMIYRIAEVKDREVLERLRSHGMEINMTDMEAFRNQVRPIYDEFAERVRLGSKMITIAVGRY